MKNLETKNIIKIGGAVFVLYLCIHYWPAVSRLLGSIFSALIPLFFGCITAYILNILMTFYEKHLFPDSKKKPAGKRQRAICLILALLSLFALIGLIAGLIVPQLINCLRLLISEIPVAMDNLIARLKQRGIFSEELMQKISSINFQSEIRQIIETVFSGLGNMLDIFADMVSSLVSGITTAFLAFAFAIYLLIGKEKLIHQMERLAKHYIKECYYTGIQYVLSVLNDCFHRFVVGQCTEAVILGLLCTIGMLLLKLPYAFMIGAVIAFTALIPVVGAFLGGAAGAFLIFMESPLQALIFLIFLIVLQQLEGNLIYPRVVGSSIGLPGIWVLAAVTIGGGICGILGMLIGVPLAAALYRLLKNGLKKEITEDNGPRKKKPSERPQAEAVPK